MVRRLVVLLWRVLALACVALGLVGIVVPGLPTVPFLLVAAWAASHGWPKLEAWLLNHTHFGPPIRRWRENGAVPRKAKLLAITMMAVSSIVLWHTALAVWIKLLVTALMAAVAVWMWKRPEG